uniref:Scaffolding anchor of CK1 domain-containing protein n=1 Tax=Knipowitschia caucasica TaxID=637954 RepID=A0AAV2LPF8_KNICA
MCFVLSLQLIALTMDVFTDVDIFKELISAALRGVVVYLLLDQTHFSSFTDMCHKLGVCLSDIKNIRVRTVQGLQYQCQSSMKFHGALEQKFILIDCRTVLYGTYSYTWTYEKLNLSMVLVITGQLVSSYDEEFRRLYARSVVPPLLSREKMHPTHYLNSPSSSQLSLHQLHLKNKGMNGYGNGVMTRGVSLQDRLHHFPEMGSLVRGHSYGSDLQKFNSGARLRMGMKDIGLERHGSALRQKEFQNRSTQQHLRHQSRYGADHNLIPFNSETSLNKWKLDAYLNGPLDPSMSPVGSPYSSYTGLNELQSQNIHLKSKDIRQRMEETRQKRLSLQDYANLHQSQESLRNIYLTQERPKAKYLSRGKESRQSAADLEEMAHQSYLKKEAEKGLPDGKRSVSHNDFKSMTERKLLTYNWHDAMSRSTSDLEVKANDPSGKIGPGLKHQRHMESLTEIPEEKEGASRVNSSDLVPQKEEQTRKDDKVVSFEEKRDAVKERKGSAGKITDVLGSGVKDIKKVPQMEVENGPKKSTLERKANEEAKPQDASSLQRRNSVKSKVSPDDKKPGKKDSLQRKLSLRSQKLSGSNQSLRTESSMGSTVGKQEPTPKKSQKSPTSPIEEKTKLAFSRFSPQRLSKRKTDGSRSALNDEAATAYEARKEKVYSRYEYLLGRDDKSSRGAPTTDSDKSSTLDRKSDGSAHSQSTGIGRFMQKLIGNKTK